MGFDTSFHPVPADLIAERILPWVLGADDDLADLHDRAVALARIRFTANAWGLGALKVDDSPVQAMLHVFGRPFLVTAHDVAGRAEQIDAFLDAGVDQAADVARAHLDVLQPGLAARTTPATDGRLPPDDALRAGLTGQLEAMRHAVDALRASEDTVVAFGERHAAAPLLGRELARIVLEYAAAFRPGWMSRGPTWPSHVLHDHPVRTRFVSSIALIRPAVEAFPDVPWLHADSIEENYMVGGCLPADDVAAVCDALPTTDDLDRQKLVEALQDAAFRGLPLAEATEIYSGPAGTLN